MVYKVWKGDTLYSEPRSQAFWQKLMVAIISQQEVFIEYLHHAHVSVPDPTSLSGYETNNPSGVGVTMSI